EAVIDVGNGIDDLRRASLEWMRALVCDRLVHQIFRVLCVHCRKIFRNNEISSSERHHAAVLEPQRPIPKCLHIPGGRGDEKDRDTSCAELMNLPDTALAEVDITDGKGLVNQKNLWIDVNGDGECQPDRHPRGISLYRTVHKLANLCERLDFGE